MLSYYSNGGLLRQCLDSNNYTTLTVIGPGGGPCSGPGVANLGWRIYTMGQKNCAFLYFNNFVNIYCNYYWHT